MLFSVIDNSKDDLDNDDEFECFEVEHDFDLDDVNDDDLVHFEVSRTSMTITLTLMKMRMTTLSV